MVRTPADARRLLVDLGASQWLVRHHELVVEAAQVLASRVRGELGVAFDHDLVVLGAALHDAGKVIHIHEMSGPGHAHEAAGEQLLISHGISEKMARFCVTHAAWDDDARTVEDLLVALADKLWKGKREEALEQRAVARIAELTHREPWEVFAPFDAICEAIAADGPGRLERSRT
jgi:HD superfamily phosphodiesterase